MLNYSKVTHMFGKVSFFSRKILEVSLLESVTIYFWARFGQKTLFWRNSRGVLVVVS